MPYGPGTVRTAGKEAGVLTYRFRRTIATAVVAAMVLSVLGLVGCQPAGQGDGEKSDEPAKGGTMTFFIVEPAFIDPYNAQESEGVQVVQAVFDSLTAIDPISGKAIPAAAASWEPNADATVWTFKLVEGAKFHDGTPVTAKDFVYAFNRIATSPNKIPDAASEIAYHLSPIKGFDEAGEKGTDMAGVKAIDDMTLEITLSYSWGDFAYVLAHPAFGPVPQAAVEKDPKAFADMPVGNGPFKMAEPWKHDQYVKVVADPDYYGDKPFIDGVDFTIFKDEETAFREFQAGTVDFTEIPQGQIQTSIETYGESKDGWTVNPGEQVLIGPEAAIYYYSFNVADPVMKDVKVRQALSMAINRQALADTVYEGTREPADSFIPKGMLGYEPGIWPETTYDLEGAKKLLAEAGYPEGKGLPEIKINFNTGGGHEKPMELISSDWAKLGIKTKSEGLEFPQHIDKMQSHKYQVGRAGWIADYPIMDNFTYPEFLSTSADNWSGFKDLEVDAALEKARATIDEDARIKAYQDIEKKIAAASPVAPLVWYAHRHVGSERLNDFVYDNIGLGHFEKVWLTPEEPASK
ncbi:MAG: ABC transporter substrate-binding protein [Coriobacteriaceae bacterium]|nr:ABC transporter substrate-binding protein [Coriobacteriaceae bacterium]